MSRGSLVFTILVLFSLWLATSWSLFRPGFFYIHDYVHAARIGEMGRALQDGQFPVRWSANFGFGYGMPLFEFYAPLPYYVGSLLWLAGIPVVIVLKILWGLSSAVSIVGGYLAGKRWFGRWSGLVLAALFGLAPYRAVNLFVRGALSEVWGVMTLPWIALGAYKIIKGERSGWWLLVGGSLVLMLSHNLTTLMFLPLVAAWAGSMLISEWWQRRATEKKMAVSWLFQRGFSLSSAWIVAGLLAAFYMVPAVMEKSYTKIDSILGGYFHYSQHFLYLRQFLNPTWGYGGSEWGPNDGISFFLGWGQWLGLGLFVVAMILKLLSKTRWSSPRLYITAASSLALLSFCLFMSLARSSPIWDSSSFLYIIQFPWRWLGSAGFWLAVVGAAGVAAWPRAEWRGASAILLVAVTVLGNTWWFQPESIMTQPDDYHYTDTARITTYMSDILPDYIPNTLDLPVTPATQLITVPDGVASQIGVVIDRGHQKLLYTTFTSPVTVQLAIANFPGWQAELDGQEIPLKEGQPAGTIAVEVPAGEHSLAVSFNSTPIRHWSDWTSAIGVLICVGVAWRWSVKASTVPLIADSKLPLPTVSKNKQTHKKSAKKRKKN